MSESADMKLDLDYLYRQKDRYGKWAYYFRRGTGSRRTKVRLPDPSDPSFYKTYAKLLAEAEDAPPRPAPRKADPKAVGTLQWLCERYYACAEFKALRDSTKRTRKRILDGICEEEWRDTGKATGSLGFATMKSLHVREIRDKKADLHEAANSRIKALRAVYKWAKDVGHVTVNPTVDIARIRKRTDGFHTWTVEEVERFMARWPIGTKEYLALALLLFTGARRQDAVRLGLGMERDGDLCFRAEKTGAEIVIPIRPELREAINACQSGHMTYLVTEYGKPFSVAGFGKWFGDRCRMAHVPGRAHGLRKAGATILADNDATTHELMSIYGWTDIKIAELYTRKANRKKLAHSGMGKMRLGTDR